MADLAGFRAYHTARGNSAPTDAAEDVANAALVRATDYITDEYVYYFKDEHKDPLPSAVDDAIYQAALSELTVADDEVTVELVEGGFWGKTYTPADAKVLVAVDTIKWVYTGDKSGKQFPMDTRIEGVVVGGI